MHHPKRENSYEYLYVGFDDVSETVLGMIGYEMALRGGVSSQLETGDSLTFG